MPIHLNRPDGTTARRLPDDADSTEILRALHALFPGSALWAIREQGWSVTDDTGTPLPGWEPDRVSGQHRAFDPARTR